MSNHKQFTRTAIVLALSAIFPVTAAIADDDVEALTNPNVADVSANLPYINKINPLYRQYNGINHEGLNGNADIDIVNRDEDGNWFKLHGQNLGLSTQEAGVSYEKQGDWAVGLDYNQIPRYAPFQIKSNTAGIGTNTITQATPQSGYNPATPGNEVTLKTQRDITTLTGSKFLAEGLKFSFSVKNENKTGTRMDGVRGESSSTNYPYQAFLFAPEPIDQRHNQFEATLDYNTAKLQVSAGYYGSYLTNNNDTLTINGVTNAMPYQAIAGSGNNRIWYAPISPIALAPDNSFNQFFVNSAYNFTESTRGNLKVSYSEGKQSDQFGYQPGTAGYPASFQPPGGLPFKGIFAGNPVIPATTGGSLDGKVQTTEVFASLTSRVSKDLNLLASWRYEDKDDKTPLRQYGFNSTYSIKGNSSPVVATDPTTTKYYSSFTTNNPESHTLNVGKVEADYRLGAGYAVTAGVDYSHKASHEWDRTSVTELTYRAALRKSMGETVNGSLLVAHSSRDGSEWGGLALAESIYPVYLADRDRNKVRAMVDWAATEQANVQFAYEAYFDTYTKGAYGLENGQGQVFSLDGTYLVNDDWKLNAWYSKQIGDAKQNMQGAVCSANSPNGIDGTCGSGATTNRSGPLVQWDATLKQNSDQFGLGLKGKIQVVEVGAQYLYARDRNEQDISSMPATTFVSAKNPTATVAAGNGVLPDTSYSQSTFKVYAVYPMAKATKLRLDYIYDQRKMDDYTWSSWVYADGTKVYVDPNQVTQIIGLSLIQSF